LHKASALQIEECTIERRQSLKFAGARLKILSHLLFCLGLAACAAKDGYLAEGRRTASSVPDSQLILSPDVDYLREKYSRQKVRLSQMDSPGFSLQSAHGEVNSLPAGTRLSALIDNECLASVHAAEAGLSAEIAAPGSRHKQLPLQAYDFSLEAELPLPDFIARINGDACFVGVTDYREVSLKAVPNDPQFASSAHHSAALLNTGEAWDWFYNAEKGIKNDVIVAVVDTGIRNTHEDLSANMFVDANGHNGFDFVNKDNDPADDNGHGTHCAGIIGAIANNGRGGAGVMGTRVKLMSVKVLNAQGSGSFSAIVNGINYASVNGAKVINLSFGVSSESASADLDVDPGITGAIQNAVARGAVVVIAAGNENFNMDQKLSYPANQGKRFAGVITVGSLDTVNRTRSAFSNFGTAGVEIFAPGSQNSRVVPSVGIFSTFVGSNSDYRRLQGTSMSAPMVAGAAALAIGMLSANQIDPSPAQIESLLHESAAVNPNLVSLGKGGKDLNLKNLVVGLANAHAGADPRKIVISRHPAAVTIGEGNNVVLSVTAMSFPETLTYQWQKAGVNIPGASGRQLSLVNVGPADLSTYRVLVGNTYAQLPSDGALVNVLYRPRITSQMNSVLGSYGRPQDLSVQFIANPAASFQWFRNGLRLFGQTSAHINFAALDWTDRGSYTVQVSNSQGQVLSAPIQLELNAIERPVNGGLETEPDGSIPTDGGIGRSD